MDGGAWPGYIQSIEGLSQIRQAISNKHCGFKKHLFRKFPGPGVLPWNSAQGPARPPLTDTVSTRENLSASLQLRAWESTFAVRLTPAASALRPLSLPRVLTKSQVPCPEPGWASSRPGSSGHRLPQPHGRSQLRPHLFQPLISLRGFPVSQCTSELWKLSLQYFYSK